MVKREVQTITLRSKSPLAGSFTLNVTDALGVSSLTGERNRELSGRSVHRCLNTLRLEDGSNPFGDVIFCIYLEVRNFGGLHFFPAVGPKPLFIRFDFVAEMGRQHALRVLSFLGLSTHPCRVHKSILDAVRRSPRFSRTR